MHSAVQVAHIGGEIWSRGVVGSLASRGKFGWVRSAFGARSVRVRELLSKNMMLFVLLTVNGGFVRGVRFIIIHDEVPTEHQCGGASRSMLDSR